MGEKEEEVEEVEEEEEEEEKQQQRQQQDAEDVEQQRQQQDAEDVERIDEGVQSYQMMLMRPLNDRGTIAFSALSWSTRTMWSTKQRKHSQMKNC